jgi:hypothetical protein
MCYDENKNCDKKWSEFETPLQCVQPQEWSIIYLPSSKSQLLLCSILIR